MHDNRHIVFFREQGGDENWRIWRVDLQSGDIMPLTPGAGVKSFVQQASRHFPIELLIGHNERDKRYFDLYRVNVATGESTLVQVNDGFARFSTDRQFHIRHATRMADNGDVEHLRRSDGGDWQPFVRIASDDAMATRPVEFSEDGGELYWLDSRGRNTAAVMAQDVESGTMRVLAEDQRADFTGLVLDPLTRSSDRGGSHLRTPSLASARPRLPRRFRLPRTASLPAISASPACRETGATGSSPICTTTRRVEYFHYDRDAKHARRLFSSKPALEGRAAGGDGARHHSHPRRARPRLLPVAAKRRARRGGCRWC